jgi:hypothetical protein
LEDAAYIEDIEKLGYRAAYLEDLEVQHAGGPYYASTSPEKAAYWRRFAKTIDRKNTVKRVLLRLPFVARLNQRLRMFAPPAPDWDARRAAVMDIVDAETPDPARFPMARPDE